MSTAMKCGGLCRQLVAGSAGSLGVLASSIIFAWVSPILPKLLGPNSEIPMSVEQASWMVTMPEFGIFLSPVVAGYLADRLGRKFVILLAAPIFLIGWIIILYFKTLTTLNIARIVQGLAIGIMITVMPMYLGEIASPKYRGTVISVFYCMWWFGFLLEYILGSNMAFDYFTYTSASISIIFFVAFIWQPESPYYYLMKNEVREARKSLAWLLCSSDEEVDLELHRMKQCIDQDFNKKVPWKELFATATDRKALMILFLTGFLREFCGTVPLSVYSTQTLNTAGDHFFISPDNITIVMGILMFVGSVTSLFTIDVFGRKVLMLFSCTISGISMFCAGTFYLFKTHTSFDVASYSWVPPISFFVLSGTSVVGIFPVNIAYASELFTSETRGTAASLFSVFITMVEGIALKTYSTILYSLGAFVNFYLFSAVCFLGTILSYFVLPETKGMSFEQIRNDLRKK